MVPTPPVRAGTPKQLKCPALGSCASASPPRIAAPPSPSTRHPSHFPAEYQLQCYTASPKACEIYHMSPSPTTANAHSPRYTSCIVALRPPKPLTLSPTTPLLVQMPGPGRGSWPAPCTWRTAPQRQHQRYRLYPPSPSTPPCVQRCLFDLYGEDQHRPPINMFAPALGHHTSWLRVLFPSWMCGL